MSGCLLMRGKGVKLLFAEILIWENNHVRIPHVTKFSSLPPKGRIKSILIFNKYSINMFVIQLKHERETNSCLFYMNSGKKYELITLGEIFRWPLWGKCFWENHSCICIWLDFIVVILGITGKEKSFIETFALLQIINFQFFFLSFFLMPSPISCFQSCSKIQPC